MLHTEKRCVNNNTNFYMTVNPEGRIFCMGNGHTHVWVDTGPGHLANADSGTNTEKSLLIGCDSSDFIGNH